MASRRTMARPKRAGETFARTHHNDDGGGGGEDAKRVKFDVRNPSTLAPDAEEDDAVLDADVIGVRSNAKRGAVNIDGYDSDSDNENLNARAEARKRGAVNILEQLDNYNAKGDGTGRDPAKNGEADDDDDDDDMFAGGGDDDDHDNKKGKEDGDGEGGGGGEFTKSGRKKKDVRFLDSTQIDGQEATSRSGGRIHLDERESSDDEEDLELAIEEEGVDEEVGAGGLKRNAPKVEAFHLKAELEEGGFDQDGNYVRKANDPNAVHDNWLDGLSKKDMRRAAAAHERREAEARRRRISEDGVMVADLLALLIPRLERTETPLEALARLGRDQAKMKNKNKKKTRPTPSWKLKKTSKDGMEVDRGDGEGGKVEDAKQIEIKEAIDAITDAADKLLSRGHDEIYDQERELLVREYRRETGEDWVERPRPAEQEADDGQEGGGGGGGSASAADGQMWEYRWTHGQDDAAKQGPFDGPTMKAWKDAGYFVSQGVEFRPVGGYDWVTSADF
ncbi:LIN1-like protein [Escovopsis weberi]|uniref:LIN1-like protein n=1 Tax=Escovopsis weberi TaxID=150374 RepID=A0A0M9VV22_ESCWE|nr:LIN1-like protein [Escovopsis weberi]